MSNADDLLGRDGEEPDLHASAAGQAHRYSGAVGIGKPSDTVELDRGHDICVTYCLTPGQRRRGARCPSCYGKVAIRALSGDEIEPAGTRFAWLVGSFMGGWAAAWRDATVGMMRKPAAEE